MRKRGRGRPRDAAVDRAIFEATIALLKERGLHGLTIDAVAARAKVGRPSLYRRFGSREELVVATLASTVRPLRDPATGDARRDLLLVLRSIHRDLDARVGKSVLAVHAAVQPDTPLAAPLIERYLGPRALVISAIVARGRSSGQLLPNVDDVLVRDLVFGPAVYHLLMTSRPMSARRLADTFDAAWRAIAAPPGRPDLASPRPPRQLGGARASSGPGGGLTV